MAEPNDRDREWAGRYFSTPRMDRESYPRTFDGLAELLAAYRVEVEKAERERVLEEVEAALRREFRMGNEQPGAVVACIDRLRGEP